MRRISLPVIVLVAAMILSMPLSAQDEGEMKKTRIPMDRTRQKTEKAPETKIEVVEIEPFSYAAVELTGSYEQHSDAFMKLYSAAGQQGVPMTGAPFGIYYNSPEDTAEEDLKWEIGLPAAGDKELLAPIVLKKWEHTMVAQSDFEGALDTDEIKAVYYSMYEWIGANGYEMTGPMMERFLSAPSQNDKGETVGKVQILFPVQKKK